MIQSNDPMMQEALMKRMQPQQPAQMGVPQQADDSQQRGTQKVMAPPLKPGYDGGHMPPMEKQNPYQTPYDGMAQVGGSMGAPMGGPAPKLDRGNMGGGIMNLMRMLQRKKKMGMDPMAERAAMGDVAPMDPTMGDENSLMRLLAMRRNSGDGMF